MPVSVCAGLELKSLVFFEMSYSLPADGILPSQRRVAQRAAVQSTRQSD